MTTLAVGRPRASKRDWRDWIVLALALAAALVIYAPLLDFEAHLPEPKEIEGWFFQVGSGTPPAVVALISFWLLYRRRTRVANALGAASAPLLGGALLAASTALSLWSRFTDAPDLLVPALMAGALGVAGLAGGTRLMRIVLLPVGFMVFAAKWPAPLVNETVWAAQLATAHLSGALLDAIGFSSFVSGEQILQSGSKFAIIEACAGLRTIETLTMLAVMMVDLFHTKGWRACVVVAAAPLVAFMMNTARCIALMLTMTVGSNEVVNLQGVVMHNVQGIAMLMVGLTLLYLLDSALARLGGGVEPESTAARRTNERPAGRPQWIVALWLCLTAGAATAVPRFEVPMSTGIHPRLAIPEAVGGWKGRDHPIEWMFLGTVSFNGVLSRRYQTKGAAALLFVGKGDHSMRFTSSYSPKTSRPGSGWMIEERGSRFVDPLDREVETLALRKGIRRRLVYHWREDWRGLGRETFRTASGLDRSPFARRGETVVVRLEFPFEYGNPNDRGRGEQALDELAGSLRPYLAEVRSGGRKEGSAAAQPRPEAPSGSGVASTTTP